MGEGHRSGKDDPRGPFAASARPPLPQCATSLNASRMVAWEQSPPPPGTSALRSGDTAVCFWPSVPSLGQLLLEQADALFPTFQAPCTPLFFGYLLCLAGVEDP